MKAKLLPLLAALGLPVISHAFNVSPMVAEFDPTSTKAHEIFVLTNNSGEAKPVEITVSRPVIDKNGIETLEPGVGEENFLIIPQQLILPPDSRRSVKVFYVGNPIEKEDTYRIIFKELPVALAEEALAEGENSFKMQVTMEYHTRIWISPKGLKENLEIVNFNYVEMPAPKTQNLGEEPSTEMMVPMLNLSVANTGQKHGYLRYPELTIFKKSGGQVRLEKAQVEAIAGQVLFAKQTRDFKLPWTSDLPGIDDIDRIQLYVQRK